MDSISSRAPNSPEQGIVRRVAPNRRQVVIVGLMAGLGRGLIIVGLLILSFAFYQLWGTGLTEARAQDALARDFENRLAQLEASAVGVGTDSSSPGAGSGTDNSSSELGDQTDGKARPSLTVTDPVPPAGVAMGRIVIPAIGVDKTFIEGIARDDLRLGPGHYPDTPAPGQTGNAAIAGHRTTNGAPFFDLDKLRPGDRIEVTTMQGQFLYEVDGHKDPRVGEIGHLIVPPRSGWVLDDFGDNRLTLTACHPKYSAEQRIVVTAKLLGQPAPTMKLKSTLIANDRPDSTTTTVEAPPTTGIDGSQPTSTTVSHDDPPVEPGPTSTMIGSEVVAEGDVLDQGLGWNFQYLGSLLVWSALTALVVVAGWLMVRPYRRLRWWRYTVYGLTSVIFLPCLFVTFGYLDRMIPAV